MSKPVVIPNTFAAQAGPIPLSQLDADFAVAAAALNDLATYSNYFVDSSGAPNIITVTVGAPLTFAYSAGMPLQVKLATTNTSTTVNINVNALGNKTVILNDGTAPPVGSLTANSILDLMYDGVSFRVLSMRGSTPVGLFGDGTVGAPSISFASDTDTGIYRGGTNTLNIATGGAQVARWDGINFYNLFPMLNADGAAATPSYSFFNSTGLGVFRNGANNLGFSTAGALRAQLDATGQFGVGSIAPADLLHISGGGQSSRGALRISDSGGTNFWTLGRDNQTTGNFVFALGTSTFLSIDTTGHLLAIDGTAANPALTSASDPDTGFYRDTANQIAIALGGATGGQIAQGTFTGTGTGFTAGTTATINYLRVGNIVFLWAGAGLAGTSNATTFTMTGIPAVIQPATTSVTCAFVATDNNANALAQGSVTGGTMTFSKWTSFTATSTTSWTNALTKGLPPSWSCSYTLN
jgi:hypothetical protein